MSRNGIEKDVEAIKSLKNRNASSPWGLTTELIKKSAQKLHKIIATLFDECMNTKYLKSGI